MKFRNVTTDALWLPYLDVIVQPGDVTPEVDDAEGLLGQVDRWSAVGKEAKAHQQEAVAVQADTSEQEN